MAGEIVDQRAVGHRIDPHHPRAGRKPRTKRQPPSITAERQGVNRAGNLADRTRRLAVLQGPTRPPGRRSQPRAAANRRETPAPSRPATGPLAGSQPARPPSAHPRLPGASLTSHGKLTVERADEPHPSRLRLTGLHGRRLGRSWGCPRVDPATHQLLLCGRERLVLPRHPAIFVRIEPAARTARSRSAFPGRSPCARDDPARMPSSESSDQARRKYRACCASRRDDRRCNAWRTAA